MKGNFSKNIEMDVQNLTAYLLQSKDFKREDSPSYGGQIYNTASMNKVFIKQVDGQIIEFSENGGYGGTLEVIALCEIRRIDEKHSKMTLNFKFGNFNVNLLKNIFIIILLIAGLTSIFELLVGLVFVFMSLFLIVLIFNKKTTINLFLKRISSSLEVENTWK